MKYTLLTLTAAVALALLALPAVPDDDAGAPDKKVDAKKAADLAFKKRVNDAIDTGVIWLVSQQREDGSWAGYESKYPMGMTSLCLLTVLKCDYPRKSNAVKKAMKWLLAKYREQKKTGLKTYSIAILMMALEELHADRKQEIKVDPKYGRSRKLRRVNLPNLEHKWMAELAKWMVKQQNYGGVWRYPRGGYDYSNTQYALLGLAAARRCGVPIEKGVFLTTAKHLLDRQEKTGPRVRRIVHVDQGEGYAKRYLTNTYDYARGWGYVEGKQATGSMTTAGVSSLLICRSELMKWAGFGKTMSARTEKGIADGLAWLTKNFSVTTNPPGGRGWHFYYLFGLERAGVLADMRFLGDHDWYREGADYLIGRQATAGFWPGRGDRRLTDTCFALLFLRRATVPVRVPRAVTPAAGK